MHVGRGGNLCDLIDTLWNVKYFFMRSLLISVFDLIDTLWNVKDGLPRGSETGDSI